MKRFFKRFTFVGAWLVVMAVVVKGLFKRKGKADLEYEEKQSAQMRETLRSRIKAEAERRRKSLPTINPSGNVDNRDIKAELLARIRRDRAND